MFSDAIHYSDEQYEKLRETFRRWWDGSLGRPTAGIIVCNQEKNHSRERMTQLEKQAKKPPLCFQTSWDFSIPVTDFVDRFEADIDQHFFYGESFPMLNVTTFGPGTAAALMGAIPHSTPATVWFEPPKKDMPLEEMHFECRTDNKYYQRVADIYEAAMDRFGGMCVISMVDLGGILDILAHFRGSENLLMDLYDDPDEVLRCVKEIQEAWFGYFDKFNAIMDGTRGYSHWFGTYSETPSYIFQSDFCYMISPEMFRDFVAWELKSSANRVKNAIYHLDGIGELNHLDQILAMDEIKAIQWVPGDGEPSRKNWDHIHRAIIESGRKSIQSVQNADGSLLSCFKGYEGSAYCSPRWFENLDDAKRYAELLGFEI